jgi:hypothetical protein
MSDFGKDPLGSAVAEGHILRGEHPGRIMNAPRGATSQWNSKPVDWENSAPGVNYIPDSQAGHTTK